MLDAAGPNVDSLTVKLQIHSPTTSWSTIALALGRLSGVRVRRLSTAGAAAGPSCGCERYLETFFDSAFVPPVAADSGRYWERPDHRMSELMQLVPQLWDVKQVRDTTAVFDSIMAEKPTSYDELADRVRKGIRSRPAIVIPDRARGLLHLGLVAGGWPRRRRVVRPVTRRRQGRFATSESRRALSSFTRKDDGATGVNGRASGVVVNALNMGAASASPRCIGSRPNNSSTVRIALS